MTDLRCRECGVETSYADASISDTLKTCNYDKEHNWKEINQWDQIPGDAWRNTKDADLWATHELRCLECDYLFLTAYGGKAKAIREFGGTTEKCPKCETVTCCIESKHKNYEEAIKDL